MSELTKSDLHSPQATDTPPPTGQREQAIREGVLAALGIPSDLLRVAVVPLWGDHFRVNVWTGGVFSAAAIPNSFFVIADNAGAVLRAEPPIQKQY